MASTCTIDDGDTSWILVSTALVMLMILALGFFEAGLLRAKNALSVINQCVTGMAIGSGLWFVVGLSLTYGRDQNGIIGTFEHAFFLNVPWDDCWAVAPTIPALLWATYQMMFAVITPLLITGAWAERFKFASFAIFIILWDLFVYYPVAHWIWGQGWLMERGVLDFAGGLTIHTTAGTAAFVCAIMLGRRINFKTVNNMRHNIVLTCIGATLLWFGWFGFNAGSALHSRSVAAVAFINTHIAASCSMCVWILLPYFHHRHVSLVEAVNGAIAGLAGVTPASGYITPQSSFVLGIILGLISYYSVIFVKGKLRVDDVLDVSSVHGLTGIIGSIAIGFASTTSVNPKGTDGLFYGGGLSLLGIQLLATCVAMAWSGTFTYLIIRFLQYSQNTVRISAKGEVQGLDEKELKEKAYDFDIDDVFVDYTDPDSSPIPTNQQPLFRGSVEPLQTASSLLESRLTQLDSSTGSRQLLLVPDRGPQVVLNERGSRLMIAASFVSTQGKALGE
eukprot:GILJ01002283.1.p1 GENE.GILJ01002283.1~~GILJ01002283.1.p1  ORF type:complete len:505 (-),score=55.72 GILJ01002283.1:198-1712(-)